MCLEHSWYLINVTIAASLWTLKVWLPSGSSTILLQHQDEEAMGEEAKNTHREKKQPPFLHLTPATSPGSF